MLRRLAGLAPSLVLVAVAAVQGQAVTLRAAGPDEPARLVRRALAGPHDVLIAVDSSVEVGRGSVSPRTLVIVGGDAKIAATVRGDVVVIDGDLYLHPGAVVEGSAIAIGGCVYPSALAEIRGELTCLRDATYVLSPVGTGYALDYLSLAVREVPAVSLPLAYGFRLPEYNRVDALALAWGPRLDLDSARITLDAVATFRSDLGSLDPSLSGRALFGRFWGEVRAERATFSNDRWILADLINSASTFFVGKDTRNYYRADRLESQLGRRVETASIEGSVWVGARTERAWSVHAGGPWSVLGRDDLVDGMTRPNPPIDRGRITSALAGARGSWQGQDVRMSAVATGERGLDTPTPGSFTQLTLDVAVGFPTFGNHTFSFESHAVATVGDATPRQRFAYLGGSGTIPTLDLLELGGDRLVFVDSRYSVPIERLRVPLLGPPIVTLRHVLGSAGVGTLPDFVQNIALRVALSPLRAEIALDPATSDTNLSFGAAFSR
ncbi:MAG: hypothetical protein M3373_01235 [Gemmatimonadota bacterium]|nr:hypothetical protein [Gemmatimonadota bacterium]